MIREIERTAARAFEQRFGRPPERIASSPGRVNLIGEHTDYNGGYVLPCAINRRISIAVGRGGDQLYSPDYGETRPATGEREGSWADYPRGVAWALRDAGYAVDSFCAAIHGDVPRASGLSSSAAIECATAIALDSLYDLRIDRKQLALLTQRAENQFVGVNSGIMDQYASLLCREGNALFIDCRTLDAEQVPLDLEAADLTLMVCDTQVERSLAGTGYNERRATCEEAARQLGIEQLRDATVDDLGKLSGVVLQRARHVVTEDARVIAAVEALRRCDFLAFGRLMYESHASLRDDYQVSIPPLDTFVDTAQSVGAVGARLTGAGFGGCAIALIDRSKEQALVSAVSQAFEARDFVNPVFYSFRPADGAEVVQ